MHPKGGAKSRIDVCPKKAASDLDVGSHGFDTGGVGRERLKCFEMLVWKEARYTACRRTPLACYALPGVFAAPNPDRSLVLGRVVRPGLQRVQQEQKRESEHH